jgi:integrase
MSKKESHNLRNRAGQWHYRFKYRGREYSGSTGLAAETSNQNAAEEFVAAKLTQIRGDMERENTPFDQAAGRFVAWCETVEYRRKPRTALRIKTSFASLVEFFRDTPVRRIAASPGLIDDYKAWRITQHGIRDVTLRKDLHNLSLFFGKWAVKRGLAESNPLSRSAREQGKGVTIPSEADAVRIHPLSAEEEEKYFTAAATIVDKRGLPKGHAGLRNLYDVAKIMLLQGARPEEVVSRRKEDYDAKAGELRVTFGKSKAARRTLHLCEEAQKIIEARMKLPGEWLFPSPRYPDRHIVKLNKAHDTVCKDTGLSFVLYDLRHTFGTRMAQHTDAFTLAALMGHANLRTIQRYVHPQDETKKTAMQRYEAERTRAKLKVVSK